MFTITCPSISKVPTGNNHADLMRRLASNDNLFALNSNDILDGGNGHGVILWISIKRKKIQEVELDLHE